MHVKTIHQPYCSPFARILRIANNELSLILAFACIKKFMSGRSGGLWFGLTYVGETKHRLLIDMQYNMINMAVGCLLCQLICSSIVMSRYMNNFKVTQGKFCI